MCPYHLQVINRVAWDHLVDTLDPKQKHVFTTAADTGSYLPTADTYR